MGVGVTGGGEKGGTQWRKDAMRRGGREGGNAMAQGRYEEGGREGGIPAYAGMTWCGCGNDGRRREGGSEVRGVRGSAFRDVDGACLAFIDHREISEDISS